MKKVILETEDTGPNEVIIRNIAPIGDKRKTPRELIKSSGIRCRQRMRRIPLDSKEVKDWLREHPMGTVEEFTKSLGLTGPVYSIQPLYSGVPLCSQE